jgi:uncharacterized OsmC-like protein
MSDDTLRSIDLTRLEQGRCEAGRAAYDVLPRAVQQSHYRLCSVSRTVEVGTPVETVVA